MPNRVNSLKNSKFLLTDRNVLLHLNLILPDLLTPKYIEHCQFCILEGVFPFGKVLIVEEILCCYTIRKPEIPEKKLRFWSEYIYPD